MSGPNPDVGSPLEYPRRGGGVLIFEAEAQKRLSEKRRGKKYVPMSWAEGRSPGDIVIRQRVLGPGTDPNKYLHCKVCCIVHHPCLSTLKMVNARRPHDGVNSELGHPRPFSITIQASRLSESALSTPTK